MKRFGLLGEHLSHSMSPALHALYSDYAYDLYEVAPGELDSFLRRTDLSGMNVTIPYKKAVIPYCTKLSRRAARIGSVNTLIRCSDGWYGDNTDYAGFCAMLSHAGYSPKGKKGLVLGSGGASVTVQTALRDMGTAEIVVVSRSGNDHYQNLERHADAQLIVNATPVGMFPLPEEKLLDIVDFPRCEAVFDLIYNPLRTELLGSAERCGVSAENGLYMLAAQAFDSAEQFLGHSLPRNMMEQAWKELSSRMQNIVLIGMPGCGKSTIGKRLADRIGKPFFDADEEIEKQAGKTPEQILTSEGERVFRDMESAVISVLSRRTGSILAVGGGAVLREENRNALRRNGRIIWLQRATEKLATANRPLSQGVGVEALFASRREIYADLADAAVDNNGEIEITLDNVLEILK